MPLYGTRLTHITAEDVQRIVDQGEREGRQLDYKQVLPNIKSKDERQEFLADLCAMANTIGGDIIYGVEEKRDSNDKPTGEPSQVIGVVIDNNNWDAKQRQLRESLRDGIDPRLPGVEMHLVERPSGLPVVIIRVPPSLRAPHMIRYRPSFYYRTEGGNSPMNAEEIGQAFLRGATMQERAENFRRDRLQRILDLADAPVELQAGARTFLHVVPLGTSAFAINFGDPQTHAYIKNLYPLNGDEFRVRINFDGQLHAAPSRDWNQQGQAASYVQVFRDGSIEFCDADIIMSINGNTVISATRLETEIIRSLRTALQLYEILNIAPPIGVFVTLANVKDAQFHTNRRENIYLTPRHYEVDRDRLVPPGQLVEQLNQKPEQLLRPIFDTIWNAAGYSQSLNYDQHGNWDGSGR